MAEEKAALEAKVQELQLEWPGLPGAPNWRSPRVPVKGLFQKGEIDLGSGDRYDIDVDMDVDSDLAVSVNLGS